MLAFTRCVASLNLRSLLENQLAIAGESLAKSDLGPFDPSNPSRKTSDTIHAEPFLKIPESLRAFYWGDLLMKL
jgi:hypothetical protein